MMLTRSYGWFLRNIVLRAGDAALGHPMIPRLRFLEDAQWWSVERAAEYRDAQVRALMAAANEVPFYRDHLARSGVAPRDIRSAADLARVPVVTKDMLRADYPERTLRPTGQKTYETSTSGSTGKNFRLREDRETAGMYRAAFMLAIQWSGWQIGEKHLQTGITPNRNAERWLKDLALRCSYFSAYDLSDQALDRALEVIDRGHLEHLWGYPGSLDSLARRAAAVGFNHRLASAATWGDWLQPSQRSRIETVFNTRVFDNYGCGEGIQVAAQCGQGQNYHVFDLDAVVDYVDDDGHPVPPGTPGNVLLTRLHPGAMPFIRYRVGDMATSARGKACPCGRSWEMLESIQGRSADTIVIPGGNRLIVHFFTGVLEHFKEIDQFQILQEQADAIILRVVPTSQWSAQSEGAIVSALQRRGVGLDVRVEKVPEIPLTPGGKRRFVISTLPQT